MDGNADTGSRTKVLEPDWPWRLAAGLVVSGVYFAVVLSDVITHSYGLKVGVGLACLWFIGWQSGFKPQSEDRSIRRSLLQSTLTFSFLASLFGSQNMAGMYDLTGDERSAQMLSPAFYGPVVAFMTATLLGYFAGTAAFARLHPDRAFLPLSDEERGQSEAMPAARRKMNRIMLLVFVAFIPAFVAVVLSPKHAGPIMVATSAVCSGSLSFLIGYSWPSQDRMKRVMWLAIGLLGPFSGFVGSYSAGRGHDAAHLHRALSFACGVALVLWLPGITGRIVARVRENRWGVGQPNP